ncbi:hypothetical protein E0485_05285 [Paenibacillus albiflavus]|uniref:GIY-YIG nuclease family protein n=1 Tax=Paenibacillus albiflavus TaxID=2545760 RepID=A0A4V2WPG6_9BACL|nr:hypothetical protein [Paenibacillus albiflavus]TCZ79282.1 hypothetical protein E0485_05285 [Paenibacillus albiflavus]
MDKSELRLLQLFDQFQVRITSLNIEQKIYTIDNLRDIKRSKQEWWYKAGVYYFVQDGVVKYVGKANLGTGLRKRIYNQIEAFGEPNRWDTVISDPSVKVGMFIFPDDDWHWIASLELMLLDSIRPEMYKRLP